MDIPKVKFIYAFPLDAQRRKLFEQKELGEYPTMDEVREIQKRWETKWEEVNVDDRIIQELVDITDGVPDRALECFVFGGGLSPTSTPLLIPVMGKKGRLTDEMFIDVLIHELIHIFISRVGTMAYWKHLRETYSEEPMITQNHILVYAMLEHIYRTFFAGEPLDYSRENMPEGYQRAIDIVRDVGFQKHITEYQEKITPRG